MSLGKPRLRHIAPASLASVAKALGSSSAKIVGLAPLPSPLKAASDCGGGVFRRAFGPGLLERFLCLFRRPIHYANSFAVHPTNGPGGGNGRAVTRDTSGGRSIFSIRSYNAAFSCAN